MPHHISLAALRLARRARMHGKRVDGSGEFVGKNLIDHSVAVDPAAALEVPRNNVNPEVRLAAGPVPGVARVQVRLVHHPQALRLKRLLQLFLNARFDRHDAAIFLQPH